MKYTNLHLNEMPLPPIDAVQIAATAALADSNRYPTDAGIGELRAALAKKYAVDAGHVVVANGSLMILHQVMIAAGQQEVVYGWPSFADYPVLAEGLRMRIKPVELRADGSSDLEALTANLTAQTSLAVICTPNPPTGGIVSHAEVVQFLDRTPSEVTVLIDEAYGEFVNDRDAVRSIELVQTYPNVVVARSFSKAYGMAGLRIGYAIAKPALAKKIAAAGVPRFQITTPSLVAAMAALRHQDEIEQHIQEIIKERRRMADMFRDLDVPVVEGQGNFVWLPVGDLARKVKDALADLGVLVSPHAPYGVRVTVGTSEDTDRLRAAWQQADPLKEV